MKNSELEKPEGTRYLRCLVPFVFVFVMGGIHHPSLLASTEKIRIVATTTTIANMAAEIAQDKVFVYAVASPKRDIHFYAPTPKDVLMVKKAGVFIHGGLDLEAWRAPLLTAAGNPGFLGNAAGSIDAAKGIPLLEIPKSLSRAQGDIHLYGNPHYWHDPENGKIMVKNIADGLAGLFPEHAAFFSANAGQLIKKIDAHIEKWREEMKPYQNVPVIAYHNSWPYFAERFGLKIEGFVEPNRGIPPTAKHMNALIGLIKEKDIRLIL
ncbi:MAG: zinc ABC transporter substrate-binding protein, partial [Candidatus Omnitrophica bacterium]|nr:zinc ABC transporter substrate-binding protein [Candidatus Omnitrophota bacterium]